MPKECLSNGWAASCFHNVFRLSCLHGLLATREGTLITYSFFRYSFFYFLHFFVKIAPVYASILAIDRSRPPSFLWLFSFVLLCLSYHTPCFLSRPSLSSCLLIFAPGCRLVLFNNVVLVRNISVQYFRSYSSGTFMLKCCDAMTLVVTLGNYSPHLT